MRTGWLSPAHLCGFKRDAEPHTSTSLLITYFHNKLIPAAKPESTTPLVSKPLNPLTPNDLERRRAVSPLKIKIPSKNMREKPTNTPIIQSLY
jgi:hypothetical protein